MSIRDAARIAALESRVSELVARLEKLEQATIAEAEQPGVERSKGVARKRHGRN
jgi:hypothetical protein